MLLLLECFQLSMNSCFKQNILVLTIVKQCSKWIMLTKSEHGMCLLGRKVKGSGWRKIEEAERKFTRLVKKFEFTRGEDTHIHFTNTSTFLSSHCQWTWILLMIETITALQEGHSYNYTYSVITYRYITFQWHCVPPRLVLNSTCAMATPSWKQCSVPWLILLSNHKCKLQRIYWNFFGSLKQQCVQEMIDLSDCYVTVQVCACQNPDSLSTLHVGDK